MTTETMNVSRLPACKGKNCGCAEDGCDCETPNAEVTGA